MENASAVPHVVDQPATKKRALETSDGTIIAEVTATQHTRPPYLFVSFGEECDGNLVHELDANHPDAEEIVRIFREISADERKNRRYAGASYEAVHVFMEGHEEDDRKYPHPKIASLGITGKWRTLDVPIETGELPAATAVFFYMGWY